MEPLSSSATFALPDDPERKKLLIKRAKKFRKKVKEAVAWIRNVTGHQLPSDWRGLFDALVDGRVLCDIVEAIWPNTVPWVLRSRPYSYRHHENIESFLNQCREIGFQEKDLFAPEDLLERRNIVRPIRTIHVLAYGAKKSGRSSFSISSSTSNSRRRSRRGSFLGLDRWRLPSTPLLRRGGKEKEKESTSTPNYSEEESSDHEDELLNLSFSSPSSSAALTPQTQRRREEIRSLASELESIESLQRGNSFVMEGTRKDYDDFLTRDDDQQYDQGISFLTPSSPYRGANDSSNSKKNGDKDKEKEDPYKWKEKEAEEEEGEEEEEDERDALYRNRGDDFVFEDNWSDDNEYSGYNNNAKWTKRNNNNEQSKANAQPRIVVESSQEDEEGRAGNGIMSALSFFVVFTLCFAVWLWTWCLNEQSNSRSLLWNFFGVNVNAADGLLSFVGLSG